MNAVKNQLSRLETTLLLSGLIILLAVVFIYDRPLFYDEDDYLLNVPLLHQYGFSSTFLLNEIGSAGPLYAAVHYFFEPLTQLKAPYIRLVNVAFLVGIIYFLGCTIRVVKFARTYSLYILALPLTYLISGIALTEIPAIFFLSVGIYLVIKGVYSDTSYLNAILTFALGGFCLSLAILGRQPYLVVLFAVPILFITEKELKKRATFLVITLIFALALPCYVFFVWKGMVPPSDSFVYDDLSNQGISFRPEYFLLCLYHFSVITVIIAPGFFFVPKKMEMLLIICLFFLLAAVNYRFQLLQVLPLKSILNLFLPRNLIHLSESFGGAAVVLIAFYYLKSLYINLDKNGYQKELVFFSVASLLIALSCMKITWSYESRYAAQAIPLLVLMCTYFYRPSKYNAFRVALGLISGVIWLCTFLIP